jgi:hypothetical protein
VSIDGLSHLQRWMDAIRARPACERGVAVPMKFPDLAEDEAGAKEFQKGARTLLQR